MKCLFLILMVVGTQAYVKREMKHDISVPNLIALTVIDPLGLQAEWTPVKNVDGKDPILGYKVKIWEFPKIKQYSYETVNGVKVLVEKLIPVKLPTTDKVPETSPKEVVVNGADESSVLVDRIDAGTVYEVRVQAFTHHENGPLSQPMRVQILPKNSEHHKDVYGVS